MLRYTLRLRINSLKIICVQKITMCFKWDLKTKREGDCLTFSGRSFHNFRHAAEQSLSPLSLSCEQGTVKSNGSTDLRDHCGTYGCSKFGYIQQLAVCNQLANLSGFMSVFYNVPYCVLWGRTLIGWGTAILINPFSVWVGLQLTPILNYA